MVEQSYEDRAQHELNMALAKKTGLSYTEAERLERYFGLESVEVVLGKGLSVKHYSPRETDVPDINVTLIQKRQTNVRVSNGSVDLSAKFAALVTDASDPTYRLFYIPQGDGPASFANGLQAAVSPREVVGSSGVRRVGGGILGATFAGAVADTVVAGFQERVPDFLDNPVAATVVAAGVVGGGVLAAAGRGRRTAIDVNGTRNRVQAVIAATTLAGMRK